MKGSAPLGGEQPDDTFIDGMSLRKLFGGKSHMWPKRQAKRDPAFPKPRYVNQYPFWRLGDLRAWWAGLPTEPPPSSVTAGERGVEVLRARERKKAGAVAASPKPKGRKSRDPVAAE
jgi:hypothetical protein